MKFDVSKEKLHRSILCRLFLFNLNNVAFTFSTISLSYKLLSILKDCTERFINFINYNNKYFHDIVLTFTAC